MVSFSSGYLVVCSGDVLPAPRVVVAILRDEAMALLSKTHSCLGGRDHSADGWVIALVGGAKAVGPTMLMAAPFLFERKKDMYLLRTLFFLQAVFTTLTTTPSTPTIDRTPTSKEPSDSTLDINMSQSSQSSITEPLKLVQFAKGTRSDTPFRFTKCRTPVVKVTKKYRANPPVSTRRDVQLSGSQLQSARSPGHHYRGVRQTAKGFSAFTPELQSQSKQLPQAGPTHSRGVPARTSGTVQMNTRTSQWPTQPPCLRSLLSKPSPLPLEPQSPKLSSQLSQLSSQLPSLSEQLSITPSLLPADSGFSVKHIPTDDERVICQLAQNEVFNFFNFLIVFFLVIMLIVPGRILHVGSRRLPTSRP